jgi:hypothetical protein
MLAPVRRPAVAVLLLLGVTLVGVRATPVAAQSTQLESYVLFALTDLRTRGLEVTRGNLGASTGTLYMNSHGTLNAPTSDVAANQARIPPDVRCAHLFANNDAGTGASCPKGAGFAPPITDATALRRACAFPEPFPACSHDPAAARTVSYGSTLTLAPGTYGDVVVQGGGPGSGRLVLTGGTYTFCSLRASRGAEIRFGGPAVVRVAGDLMLSNGTSLGPILDAGVPRFSSTEVGIFVSGSRVRFARRTQVKARLYAPAARLQIGRGSDIEGTFAARTISTDRIDARTPAPPVASTTTSTTTTTTRTTTRPPTTTTTTLPAVCGDGIVHRDEQCDPAADTPTPCGPGTACSAADTATACTCVAIETPAEICGDCADNDGDGLVDFNDADCCPQRQSFAMALKRGRVKALGQTSKLRLRGMLARTGLGNVNPLKQDVFLQIRRSDGGDILCARIPAGKFRRRPGGFRFADRKHTVGSALGLDKIRISIRKDGSVRYRAFGRRVQMQAPGAGKLGLTVAFRDPAAGDVQDRCSTTVQAFRTSRPGRLLAP